MSHYDTELRAAALIEQERYQDAYQLLLPLSDKDSEYTLMALGWLLSSEVIDENNNYDAMSYYYRAASEGNPEAFLRYGQVLLGEGYASEARTTFEGGAELESLGSIYWLGSMLVQGEGGPVDEPKGISFLRQAAEKGHIFAQRDLYRIDFRNTQSLFAKAAIAIKIGLLALKAGKEIVVDRHSEKIW